ncbi:MAG TPA: hypothetical protein P5524_03040 [Candidatus Paceibacterota bacterium]|nr:hypothetical protein [Candidatus Paceibacterota bacterium]
MMIFQKIGDFFKNLQQKPEDVRRRWLWIFVISIMVVIFIFWLLSFVKSMQATVSPSPSPSLTPTPQEISGAENSSSDFLSTFVRGFKRTVSGLMSFLRPIAAAAARFFVTIFSLVLKAGDWLVRELGGIFNAAKVSLQSQL